MSYTRWAVCLSLSFFSCLHAEVPTQNTRLPKVSVTATRLTTPIVVPGLSTETIAVGEMQKRGQLNIHDILRSHPLLSLNAAGNTQGVFFTGLPSHHIRIFVDDIDIKDAISPQGTAYPDLLLIDIFSEVDIVQGAMGTLYGSDAIGGIIAFRSNPTGQFFRHYFRDNYTQTGIQVYEETPAGKIRVQHASLYDNTASAYSLGTEKDPKHLINWGLSHEFNAFLVQFHTQYKRLEGDIALDNNSNETDKYLRAQQDLFSETIQIPLGNDDLRLRYTSQRIQREDNLYGLSTFTGSTEALQILHSTKHNNIYFVSGYERQLEKGGSTYFQTEKLEKDSFFNRLLYSGPIGIGIGYRHQIYGTDSIGTYDLTTSTQIGESILGASLSTGYRTPTIYEKSNSGSTTLKAERSNSSRIWIDYHTDWLLFGGMYFDNTIDNRLDYNDTTFTYFNRTDRPFTSRGGELHMQIETDPFTAGGSFLIQEAKQGDERAWRVPNKKITLHATLKLEKMEIGTALTAVGHRIDGIGYPTTLVPLDQYVDLSAGIRYTLTDRIRLSLNGSNLLGQHIELTKNFYTVGRFITGGIDIAL